MDTPHNVLAALAALPRDATVPVGWLRDAGILTPHEQPLPRDLTVDEVADVIDRSPATVRRLARNEELRGYRHNGREWRFPRSAVREYQDAQRSA